MQSPSPTLWERVAEGRVRAKVYETPLAQRRPHTPVFSPEEIVQLLSREMIGRFDVKINKESRNAGNQEVLTAMSLCDQRMSSFHEFPHSCLPKKIFRLELLIIPQLKSWTIPEAGARES